MATWLRADATLADLRALGEDRTRRVCHTVLEELRAWLEDGNAARVARARVALGGLRARLLARSYLLEYLKQESPLNTRSRPEERAVVGLLDTFFVEDTPPGLAPALPPAEHADRARAGTEPPEP
jgi:hypothetical protein